MRFEELSHMMQKPEPKPDTYEAGMAQNQLLKIGSHAIRLHNMIDDGQEMESWVAKKIDLASNYVKSVHGYTAGSKAGTYDDDGMSEGTDTTATDKEIKMAKGIAFDKRNKDNMSKATSTIEKVRKGLSQQPDVADALKTANEDAGFNVDAWSTEKVKEFGPDLMLLTKGKPIEMPGYDSYGMELDDGRPDDDEGNVAADDSIGGEVTNAIRGHRDSLENSKFSMADYDRVKPNAATIKYAQNIINSPEFKKAYNSTESVSEDAGEQALANDLGLFFVKRAKEMLQSMERPNKNDQEYEEYVDIAQAFKKGIQAGLDEVNTSDFEFSNNPFGDFGRGIDDGPDRELVKILAKHGYQPGPDSANDKATIVKQRDESAVKEDAGEGHMSKSQLYATAKMAIELIDMINER